LIKNIKIIDNKDLIPFFVLDYGIINQFKIFSC